MSEKWNLSVSLYAGLKSSSRSIVSQEAPDEKIRFIVGRSGQIEVLDYNETNLTIEAVQSLEYPDEIWWINCNSSNQNLLYIVSAPLSSKKKSSFLIRTPELGTNSSQVKIETSFDIQDNSAKRIFEVPNSPDQIAIACENEVLLFGGEKINASRNYTQYGSITSCSADPFHPNLLSVSVGSSLFVWDTRSNQDEITIQNVHQLQLKKASYEMKKLGEYCTFGPKRLMELLRGTKRLGRE